MPRGIFIFEFASTTKSKKLIQCIKDITDISQNSIVYCSNRGKNGGVEGYAISLIESNILANHNYRPYTSLIHHLSSQFSEDWIVIRALKHGIGIHHGLIPKYIQKEIISLFNQGSIGVLISTTTITEGVNTSAKNLIVMHNKKGSKELKKFDAKNIAGRAGRFGFHYSGRVIVLDNKFIEIKDSEPEGIKHKNYDKNSVKDEIDLFHSDDKYLNESDLSNKRKIKEEQALRNIPDDIINQFKVISRADKIFIYDAIKILSELDLKKIKSLIYSVNAYLNVDYDGFQVVLNALLPIIKNKTLIFLIERKDKNGVNSVLTSIIYFYLKDGFRGSVDYHMGKGLDIDKAIQETSKLVYQILKYHVVKYLGVFNIMYKFIISQESKDLTFDEVTGIDKLLLKFEYNALTEEGRIASDYGVPSNVVKYYENDSQSEALKNNFDSYELTIFNKVNKIIDDA